MFLFFDERKVYFFGGEVNKIKRTLTPMLAFLTPKMSLFGFGRMFLKMSEIAFKFESIAKK